MSGTDCKPGDEYEAKLYTKGLYVRAESIGERSSMHRESGSECRHLSQGAALRYGIRVCIHKWLQIDIQALC